MKLPNVVSKKSDMIMFALFLTVVCGLVSKGIHSMVNQSLIQEFNEQKNDSAVIRKNMTEESE